MVCSSPHPDIQARFVAHPAMSSWRSECNKRAGASPEQHLFYLFECGIRQADAFCLGSPGQNCNFGSLSFLRVNGTTISATGEQAQNTQIGSLSPVTPATPVPSIDFAHIDRPYNWRL